MSDLSHVEILYHLASELGALSGIATNRTGVSSTEELELAELGGRMSDAHNIVQFKGSAALIEMARQEQRRLLQLINESESSIKRSRDLIARLEDLAWASGGGHQWGNGLK